MAEQKDPTPDTAPAADADTPAAGGGSRFALVLFPLILAAGAGGAFLAYSQYPKLAEAAAAVGIELGETTAAVPRIQYGQFMEIQGLIINPAGTDGTRYLMVNLGLESRSAGILEEVEEKEVVVRDTILKVLGRHTVEELADISRRSDLKNELRAAVNAIVGQDQIQRMYFTQYVLQ